MKDYSRKYQGQRGFSLVELIVAIALMAILAGVAVSTLMQERPRYQLRDAVRTLYSDIQSARVQALRSGVTATITPTANSYTINVPTPTPYIKTVNFNTFPGLQFNFAPPAPTVVGAPAIASYTNAAPLQLQSSGAGNAGDFVLEIAPAGNVVARTRINITNLGRPQIRKDWQGL